MEGQELATQFQNLVDDSFDITHMYQLFSQAKNNIERQYKLEICKEEDSTQTGSTGDGPTNLKNLPTNFRTFVSIELDTTPFYPVRFEKKNSNSSRGNRIFLDMKNWKFATTMPLSRSGTWHLFFIGATEDFTEDNEDEVVCTWPAEFHPLIPYEAAKIYQANIDADAISFRMSVEQEKERQRLLDGLINWDADLKLAAMNGRTGFDDSQEDEGIDLSRM